MDNRVHYEIEAGSTTLRGVVFRYLKDKGTYGATDERIQIDLGINANTERPRRRELVHRDLVRNSGTKRHTMSGKLATVWVVRQQTVGQADFFND